MAKYLYNVSTTKKILALVLIMSIFISMVGWMGLQYLDSAKQEINTMYEKRVLPIQSLNAMQNYSRQMENELMRIMRPGDETPSADTYASVQKIQQEMIDTLKTLQSKQNDAKEQQMLQTLEKQLNNFSNADVMKQVQAGGSGIGQPPAQGGNGQQQTGSQAASQASGTQTQSSGAQAQASGTQAQASSGTQAAGSQTQASNGQNEPSALQNDEDNPFQQVSDQIVKLAKYNAQKAEETNQTIQKHTKEAARQLIFTLIGAVLIALAIGWYVSRLIAVPIKRIAAVAKEVEDGNLQEIEVNHKRKDEIGLLENSINEMIKSLRSVISQAGGTAEAVTDLSSQLQANSGQASQASEEIAAATGVIHQGMERQLQEVSEAFAALAEVSAAIGRVTAGSDEANHLTMVSDEKVRLGKAKIDESVLTMRSVNDKTMESARRIQDLEAKVGQIDEIIEWISSIAGQTNLLALNASIEASRAGEQGRGFAVVAGEVKKLAESTKEASLRVSEMIRGIQQDTESVTGLIQTNAREVNIGLGHAEQAGLLFDGIQTNATAVAEEMNHISSIVQEINASSEQVVQNMQTLLETTKSSAAESEAVAASTQQSMSTMQEIHAAAEYLEHEAVKLKGWLDRFHLQ